MLSGHWKKKHNLSITANGWTELEDLRQNIPHKNSGNIDIFELRDDWRASMFYSFIDWIVGEK